MLHACLTIVALAAGLTTPAIGSVTIVNIGGPEDAGQNWNSGKAVATSFEIASTFTNCTISAPVSGFGAQGGMWLIREQIGPGTTVGHVVAAEAYVSASTPFSFTGVTLTPGTYFLMLNLTAGFAVWPASTSATVVTHPDANVGLDFRTNATASFAPASSFSVLLGQGRLHVNVVGEVVPAPGCAAVLAMSGVLAARRRRRA